MNEVTRSNGGPPRTVASEGRMLEVLESIDRRLARLEALETTLPAAVAATVDTLDDLTERLRERGVDVDERLHVLVEVAERLTSPEALRAVTTILHSDVLAETAVDVVGKAGAALATARAEETPRVGLLGAARAMSDDDVRRAIGFLLRVAKLFGRSLDEKTAPQLGAGEAR